MHSAPLRLTLSLALGMLLAACQPGAQGPIVVPPPEVQPGAPVFPGNEGVTAPSEASIQSRAYYARIERNLRSQGLLRTDPGGRDTPFGPDDLAENFLRIALFDEYVAGPGRFVARTTESRLRRWEQPLRIGIDFGPSVPAAQRATDRGNIAAFGQRLSTLTGLAIRVDPVRPNFHVLILNEDEREAIGPYVSRLVPGIDRSAIEAITEMHPTTYCIVFAFSPGGNPAYTRALAVIRGEHPDLLRLSCIHEEMAQGLGLANDSPAARPSIFNDDEEFALLTRQDELMLRILYDRRLRPGMSLAEARPVVEAIAAELLGGES
ncbi:MAG: hypothetical protein RLZZ528_1428 [Pseudomonadota bacterium]